MFAFSIILRKSQLFQIFIYLGLDNFSLCFLLYHFRLFSLVSLSDFWVKSRNSLQTQHSPEVVPHMQTYVHMHTQTHAYIHRHKHRNAAHRHKHADADTHTLTHTRNLHCYYNDYVIYPLIHQVDLLNEVDWQTWFHGRGMPPVKPK